MKDLPKHNRKLCVVCLKTLRTETQIENMMCDNCEESTNKIALEINPNYKKL